MASKLQLQNTAIALAICIAISSVGFAGSAAEVSDTPTIQRTKADASCGAPTSDERLEELCPQPERNIAASTVNLLKRHFTSGQINENDLCSFELLLEDAVSYCQQGTFKQNHDRIAHLMALIAEQWHKHEQYGKASATYQRAFDLRTTEGDVIWGTWLLQRWAFSRLEAGDNWKARELADAQSALAKGSIENSTPSAVGRNTMINALRFQSEIYWAIGLTRQSKEIAERVDELEANIPQ